MSPADISFVIGSMRTGGAERATLNLMNGFVAKGLKVDLVLLHKTGDFLNKVDPSVNIVDLNKSKAIYGVIAFRNYLKRDRPKRIFAVQNHIQLMVLLALKISSWKGNVILNEQSTFSKNLRGAKGYIQKFLSKYLFNSASVITAVSQGTANDLKSIFPSLASKIHVINNAIITNEFQKVKDLSIDEDFSKSGKAIIVSAGRFVKSKNFELLICAFTKVKIKIPSKLIILGDGEEMQHLKRIINDLQLNDDVFLPGFVKDPCRYFSKGDVFVLSSDYEGLPGVIIEALAAGCKVVSTNCENGPAEILGNGKFGWLSPVGDVDRLADNIQSALNSKVEKSLLIERGNDFHEEKIVTQYLELFHTL